MTDSPRDDGGFSVSDAARSLAHAMEATGATFERVAERFQRFAQALCIHDQTTITHGLTIHWTVCPRCRYGDRRRG